MHPQIHPVGSQALLIDCDDLNHTLTLSRTLTEACADGTLGDKAHTWEIIPAAQTLLIRGATMQDLPLLAELMATPPAATTSTPARQVTLPVRYDGPDLEEVATHLGMSTQALIEWHTSTSWTVAFTGFAPGFAYATPSSTAPLNIPRRETPRPRLAAGSVGLAGPFTGVYPRESPGGWQIIGHTDTPLFDLDRVPPALLTPGTELHFDIHTPDTITVSTPSTPTGTSGPTGEPKFSVLTPGLGTVIEDSGRPGRADLGVSPSGCADPAAMQLANSLVGNASDAPILELGAGPVKLQALRTTTFALAGAPRPGSHSPAVAHTVSAGELIDLGEPERGRTTILAVDGGFDAETGAALGSYSTDTLSGLGPAVVAAGDTLYSGSNHSCGQSSAAVPFPYRAGLPAAGDTVTLRVIPGPRDNWFSRNDHQGLGRLFGSVWTVTDRSDRVGVRLSGPSVQRTPELEGKEIPSEGLVRGAIQVPPDGQPIIFMADHPVTGGYPVAAVVAEEDLGLAAQLPAGARVRFEPVRDQDSLGPVLIANRGEIAVRIARAVREAGLRSIAVFADADRNAPHVRAADEAWALGGDSPAETYLNVEKLLMVAKATGARSVHPGYGFLSERADAARAFEDAGLTWIGPSPETIELLGDKARARALAAEVGAPLVAGTTHPVADCAEVVAFAEQHGLPLAIKAVAGGGGRGLRVVRRAEDIEDMFALAQREAVAAFGRGECLVERFVDRPRHIEVQIVGDRQGRVVAVGTRECSLQRRHQKLVEEAPAPGLSSQLRQRVEKAAVDVCAAAGYVGAGTVEFLLGEDGTLTFLEVNTRLQVEHPVTEMVTGIDLVAQQLRVAQGLPLDLPDTIPAHGHAIEFRINAEDPEHGFVPTPGLIRNVTLPSGLGVRVDSGVEAGFSVPASFDSLLAKLIVWAPTREEALARARRAVWEFSVDGPATVLPFHRWIVEDPAFIGAAVHTNWIDTECQAAAEDFAALACPRTVDAESPTEVVPGAVCSPFAGTLTSWKVEDGQVVAAGDTIALLEAMKMEVPIQAESGGILRHRVPCGGAVAARGVVGIIVEEEEQ